MFATDETVGLAEWIIDDTCVVTFGPIELLRMEIIINLDATMRDKTAVLMLSLDIY